MSGKSQVTREEMLVTLVLMLATFVLLIWQR